MKTLRLVLLIVALAPLLVESCGPGRGQGRRRPLRTSSPLVYKQHFPNVGEETIGASGSPEGRILRTDKKFVRLVSVVDQNIIFKDEEGTGEDRLMTPRCRDMLLALSMAVLTQWSGKVRLRVTEAWDEDGRFHSKDSLHLEGRAVDVTTSDRDRSKYGLLARLAVDAGFDWVYYESRGHIHCSVKSESSILLRHGGCFSADSTVLGKDGELMHMSDVKIGDQLLTFDISTGIVQHSDVIAFLHRDAHVTVYDFLSITTASGHRMIVTSGHMVFLPASSMSPIENDVTNATDVIATFAGRLKAGSYVYVSSSFGAPETVTSSPEVAGTLKLRVDVIVKIERMKQTTGVYAPLTTSGTLLVDGIATSCYASFNSHKMAHVVMAPLRFAHYYHAFFDSNERESREKQQEHVDGIHWYAMLLAQIAQYMFSSDLWW